MPRRHSYVLRILSTEQTISSLLDKAERILRAETPSFRVIWHERLQPLALCRHRLTAAEVELIADLSADGGVPISLTNLEAEPDRTRSAS